MSSVERNSTNFDKDAWIVCDSRSHPGLKYYVNKVTGIKVWNITDSEIALAEKVGKVGPEPSGSPTMNNPTDPTANIYNKQITNNQFSNQLSNLVLTAAAGNPYPSWENQPVNLQQQLFNSQSLPVNLQQQLFTLVPTAALTPLINQAASIQNYHQLIAQSTSLHNNPPYIPQQQYRQNQLSPVNYQNNSYNQNNDWKNKQYHRQDGTFNNTNTSDLRVKLTRRRRKSCSGSFNNDKSTTNEKQNRIESSSALFKQKPLKLAPLKTLTANPETSQWFIVVEKDIILDNYTFLDDLVTADPDCQLVVPHHVMLELRTHVSVSSDVRPRRTLRFLTQQIENGMAMLGEEEDGHSSSHKTVLTCMKLAASNNVVILISDNKETLTFKPIINGIHVFTMRAVKDILENSIKPRPSSPTMAIKIVVPNNMKKSREPENNVSKELFNHYGNNNCNKSSSNNEKVNKTPLPATINGKVVSRITGESPKPPTQPVLSTNSPELETVSKNVSVEKNRNMLVNDTLNSVKIIDENPHKSATTNISPNVQEITKRTPDNNSPSSSEIKGKNAHKHTSNVEAAQILHTTPTKAVPYNNVVDEQNEVSRRCSGTFIAPIDPNTTNSHHSTAKSNTYSPRKPLFASPKKNYNSNWKQTGNKNMHDTMDTSSTSSTSNISLDSMSIKRIISMKNLITATSKRPIDKAKEITPFIEGPRSTSSWASYDNDNTSDRSLNKTVNKNVVIEETSTSGVISNSDSFNSDKVVNPKKQDVRKVSRKRSLVMYEVVGQSMEEVLRLRSEEWVFRFVQIMEEVLRVKLQEKIPYEHKEPAPWNLQEAARCIIKKFDNYFDVVDAANKLSRFLYETSDENGKIINIEPSDYMELYSYGVYLVETFLDMCADCKEKDCRMKKNDKRGSFSEEKCSCHEVWTASELLKKLLFDIHNSNVETFVEEIDQPADFLMDSSVNDSELYDFNIETRKQSSPEVVKTKINEMEKPENAKPYPIKRKQTDALDEGIANAKRTRASSNCLQYTKKVDKAVEADDAPRKVQTKVKAGKRFEKSFFDSLQLRKNVDNNKKINGLRKKADNKVPKVKNITMGTSSDSAFFSSLQLDKKDLNNAEKLRACKITVVCSNKADDPDQHKDPPRSSPEELIGLKCHFNNEDNLVEKSPSKVVCTFKINEDIERRVKAKWYEKEYEDLEPEENMNGEYIETEEYTRSVDNTLGIDDMAANGTFERTVGDNLHERTTNGNHLTIENKVHNNGNIIQDEANAIFQGYIKNLSVRLANVFARVISLCDTYSKERMKKPSTKYTEELHRKVKIAFLLLFRIQKALKSANQRNNHYEYNFKKLLKLENTEDYFTDDRFCLQYRHWIEKCANTAEDILKDVRGILSAVDCNNSATPTVW